MNKKPEVIISLTGGLGNQLFQLAAGIGVGYEKNLYLCSSFGAPRKSLNGDTELLSFQLPKELNLIKNRQCGKFTGKVAGYILRIGVSPKGFESNKYFSRIVKSFAGIPLSFHLRKKVAIVNSVGVGFSPIRLQAKATLLFGYFQTFHWTADERVKQIMQGLSLKNAAIRIKHYELLSSKEKPLIVHVRLGDYLNEKNFGIPSKKYYEDGIRQILELKKCQSVWLFSDQLHLARNFIPENLKVPIRIIDEFQYSPAATFEVMRLGYGYVIANSTYSWWAAFLKKNSESEVIAPTPWFIGMPEPIDLIPPNWQRVDSRFEDTYQ
jgi:hypothetical protein